MNAGAKGFDISHHQDVTEAEMRAAKANGFEFVVIRASHGMTCIDTKFRRHYDAARAAGLFVFAYFYLYYANKEKSAREVANLLNVIKGLKIDGCVFIDLEHRGEYGDDYLSMLTKAECTDRALYAISEIQKAGFSAGIYADVDWMKNEMEMSRIPSDVLVWCADWHGKLDYKGRCEMRQYTSKGTIAGIGTGSVDLNELLTDYPLVPKAPTTEPCLFAIKVVKDTCVRDKPNGKKIDVAKAADNLTLGISEVSGTWGRIQNQPAAWISVNPKYTGVVRI